MPYYPPASAGGGLDEAAHDALDHTGLTGVGSPGASRWIGPWTIGAFDGQTVDVLPQDVTGGTFTLAHDGDETVPIAWDASAPVVSAALEALPSIGTGKVLSVTGGDGLPSFTIIFRDGVAVGLVTADASGLTGPSSPYAYTVLGYTSWDVPLLVLAPGDVIIDLIHSIPTAWASEGGPASLYYRDAPLGSGVWTAPYSTGPFLLDTSDSFNNFARGRDTDVGYQWSVAMREIAAWTNDAGAFDSVRTTLPAVASNEVTIYAFVDGVGEIPTAGLLRIWANVATPEAP